MLETSSLQDSMGMVVTGSDGKIKATRYAHNGLEFVPNKLYIKLLNKGFIKPNNWKVHFLFGFWKIQKGIN